MVYILSLRSDVSWHGHPLTGDREPNGNYSSEVEPPVHEKIIKKKFSKIKILGFMWFYIWEILPRTA